MRMFEAPALTRTHTHTQTHTHTHTHARARAHTNLHAHAPARAQKRTLIENYAGARLATTVNGPAGVPKGAHGRAPPVAAPEHDGAELELEPDHVFGPDADAVTKREMAKVLNKVRGARACACLCACVCAFMCACA